MNNRIFYPLLAILVLLPCIVTAWFWSQIPDTVPIHYNINMEPDRWGPKLSIWIMPGIMTFIIALLAVAPKIDPKLAKASQLGAQKGITLAVITFMSAFVCVGVFKLVGYPISLNFIHLAIIVLLGVIGNVMLKLKPNYFFGIRTPWTLESPEVWRRTHRLGGYLWVFGSVLMIPIYLFASSALYLYLFFAYIVVLAIIPIVYSAVLFFRLKKEQN